MKNIELIALDFDNLCYREPDNMYELCLEAAALVTRAYTNLTYDQSCDLVIKSWKTDRDVMTQVAKHPQCSVSYTELYKHYNAMTRYRDIISPLQGLTQTIREIPSDKHVIIVSHSTTRLVQDAGFRLGLPLVLLDRDTYGIDRTGYRRKDYHRDDHKYNDTVYDYLCDIFGVSADQALLVEDSERNLAFAKQCGWKTMHVHWQENDQDAYPAGKPSYIDYTSGNTVIGLRDLQHKKPCIK